MKYKIKRIGECNCITRIENESVKRLPEYIAYLFKVKKAIGARSIEFKKDHDFDEGDLGYYIAYGKDEKKEADELVRFEPEFASMSAKEKTTSELVDVSTNVEENVVCSLLISASTEKAVEEMAKKIVAL